MIFEFIQRLLPEVSRTNVEDDIKNTKRIFDEIAIPNLQAARDCFKLLKKTGPVFTTTNERFYTLTGMRETKYFLDDFLLVVQNARTNLNFIEGNVKKTLESSTFSEAMTLQKAQLLRAVSAFGSVADLSIRCINHLMQSEEIEAGADQEITKGEKTEFDTYSRTLFTILGQYGQNPDRFEKLIKAVPDAMVTPQNAEHVKAMFAKEGDPFSNVEANGFIPHPVMFVRAQWADFQISRYEYNKTMKKSFELRVISLRSQHAGEKNAALEKEIRYYENQAAKLQEKVQQFEERYKG